MTLILVSNRIEKSEGPRLDYMELSQQLGGELIGYNISEAGWYTQVRQVEKKLKLDLVEALTAVRRSAQHDAILSLSEKIALPLAVMMQMRRQNKPHIVVAHKLSSGMKTRLFQTWKLHQQFDRVICVCKAQADYAIHHLGMPVDQIHFVYDKVDHRFFSPQNVKPDDYILAVGQEQRDYQTLLRAVAGTGIKLIVVASSPWSTSELDIQTIGDVEVRSRIPYTELRALYAGARLVVVPLFDVDYAAGVNAVLEAMAMAKPLIISHTRGITDYIVPGETGMYVTPGSVQELRQTIQLMWEQEDEQQRLGANARQAVEEKMNLDHYVNHIVEIVHGISS